MSALLPAPLPPPLLLLLLLLLPPLGIQSRALTRTHRLSLAGTSKTPKSSYTTIVLTVADRSVAADNSIAQGDELIVWRALLHKEPPPALTGSLFGQSNGVLGEAHVRQRWSRGRRHANNGGSRGHSHLMRVGCVLGTCQVQNLSHRLYQLIGQSGRENSSPMNPRSPHSYG